MVENYTKLELSGGGSPRLLSNLFIVAAHYTCYMCIVAIVYCTHVYLVVHYKIAAHIHHILLLLLTTHMSGQLQPPNIAPWNTINQAADALVEN